MVDEAFQILEVGEGGCSVGVAPTGAVVRGRGGGGANDDNNDGNDGNKGDARVVVRPARCRPPPPVRPPLDGDGDGGGGRRGGARGCRQDWRTRRQSSACRTTGMAMMAKTTVMW